MIRQPFRQSRFIDFDAGQVMLAPMDLKASMAEPWTVDQKIDMFECRVEVWQLGVAVEMLTQIEANQPPSVWSHAAYGLVAVAFSYFEMIGKSLNPGARTSGTAGEDFNYGICDMCPQFAPANAVLADTMPTGGANPDIATVKAFRNRIRNGLYHLGYTKKGLWLHDDADSDDFEVRAEPDPLNPGQQMTVYRMNPHRVTRTIVSHFPGLVTRLRNPADAPLRQRFEQFFDQFHVA